MRTPILLIILTLGLIAGPGCTKKTENLGDAVVTDEQKLISRGRKAFVNQCIQCHNPDFTKDGSLGPAVAGSSRELLEARVLNQSYPPGYTPKRNSKVMPAMPFMKSEIDALTAYLATNPNSPK